MNSVFAKVPRFTVFLAKEINRSPISPGGQPIEVPYVWYSESNSFPGEALLARSAFQLRFGNEV